MKIEFDQTKDAANIVKHSVSLRFAAKVLADTDCLVVLDTRFDYAEERLIAYGRAEQRVWVCVFTRRGEAYRIISLRKANERETQRYKNAPR